MSLNPSLATARGQFVSLSAFDWKMEGRSGTSYRLWLVTSKSEEPVGIKLSPKAEHGHLLDECRALAQFDVVDVEAEMVDKKNGRPVYELRSVSTVENGAPRTRRAPLTADRT
jgi:hypothetical protein